MKLKLREKLLIPILFTIAAGIFSGFGYSYFASSKALKESLNSALVREVRIIADLMDKWIDLRRTDLTTWSTQTVIKEALTEAGYYGNSARKGAGELLEDLEQGYPYFDFLFVADRNGYLISTSHKSTAGKKYWVHDRSYFRESINGSVCVSEMLDSRESAEKVFVVSVPVKSENSIVGVLAGAIRVSDFGAFFMHDYQPGHNGFAYVAGRDGQIMAVSRESSQLPALSTLDFGKEIMSLKHGIIQHRYGDDEFLSAFETLKIKPWILVASQSLDERLAPARKTGYYTLITCLILLAIVGGVVTGIFRKMIYNRFDQMLYAIRRAEKGELAVRIKFENDSDEIGELSNAFNNMTRRLKKTLDNLQKEIQIRRKTEKALSRHRDTLEARVKERTRELFDLQHYLSDIINSMPSAMVGVDDKMNVVQWNLKAEDITGVTEDLALGNSFRQIFPFLEDIADKIAQALALRKMALFPKVEKTEGENISYVDVTVYPLMSKGLEGAVIRLDEVTERVQLEQLMVQTEKMMSVGGLAAGMAHEINNPLAGIMQNAQLILNRLTKPMPVNDKAALEAGTTMESINKYMESRKILHSLEAIHNAGAGAAKIVENMLSFAKKGNSLKVRLPLPKLIENTIELARNDYDLKKKYDFRQVNITKQFNPDVPEVPCEESKIMQVIFNILKNATEAMHETEEKKDDLSLVFRLKSLEKTVQIEIEDNGPGIDEAVRKRVFEPFFTTKDVDKGTGLGLSLSYFIIVEDHKGEMEVESIPGKGTKFIIRLPKEIQQPDNEKNGRDV